MHEVLVNRLGGLSLPRKSVVRLTDRPDMTLDVYRGRKTTIQQQQQQINSLEFSILSDFKMKNVIIWHWFIKNLVGTCRRSDVDATSLRRIDVINDVMCLLGLWPPMAPQYSKPWPPNILNLPTPMKTAQAGLDVCSPTVLSAWKGSIS